MTDLKQNRLKEKIEEIIWSSTRKDSIDSNTDQILSEIKVWIESKKTDLPKKGTRKYTELQFLSMHHYPEGYNQALQDLIKDL